MGETGSSSRDERPDSADYRALFLAGVPLLDVRAPIEFARGAFPGAVNVPLMDDEERHRVGCEYQEAGQQAAIRLGHELVSGERKAARIAAWAEFARRHPDGYLYCFRGGLRSEIAQRWLREEGGVPYPRVVGGYKAMRTWLIGELEDAIARSDWIVLGGLTGCGKTELLATLQASVDLEGLAHHRGSSFGRRARPQPAQIDFENVLSIDLLRKRAAGTSAFVVEDEGRFIGSRDLPPALYARMQASPLVWLEEPFEARVERVLRDYVIALEAEFRAEYGEQAGFDGFAARMRQALADISRRLGGVRFATLAALLDGALHLQRERGEVDAHRDWITVLLRDYYDPMYDYQRAARAQRVVFRGDREAVGQWLRERTAGQGR
ncbi:tRNA 2-selenouridine(34) synthase MnmH [Cupriavidus sp. AU9028]|uniref:tRNA 2-selenouridine(34) synthase MnmH n=1 Tax=Cupriavidus sp. AU9028 TaxID=2871157 RepID=UPI001C95D419|nr:tRNA 2-selenouridine(34) synthase MnmH [Cupriavidus sp. AU9028]MBY4896573.1 tRNA 2-selenouridine(34) synthase MnmH [Cupriavidus sp. AU9028]